jgi:two-component system, NarL family, response regulator DevR
MTTPNGEPGSLVRVVVAERHHLLRSSLGTAFELQADLTVVGEAYDVSDLMRQCPGLRPNVVVLGPSLNDGPVQDLCCTLLAGPRRIGIVAIVPRRDPLPILALLDAGVNGVVTLQGHLSDLVATVRSVAAGRVVLPSDLRSEAVEIMVERRRRSGDALTRYARLSPRERTILALLARGRDYQQIAEQLVISPHTARTHIQRLLGKLEIHSRPEAVAFALEHGLCNGVEVQA